MSRTWVYPTNNFGHHNNVPTITSTIVMLLKATTGTATDFTS